MPLSFFAREQCPQLCPSHFADHTSVACRRAGLARQRSLDLSGGDRRGVVGRILARERGAGDRELASGRGENELVLKASGEDNFNRRCATGGGAVKWLR